MKRINEYFTSKSSNKTEDTQIKKKKTENEEKVTIDQHTVNGKY